MATKNTFDITDAAKKFFLAGVGAVSVTAEKSKDLVDDLIKQGEISVKQGAVLNKELTKKATEAVNETAKKAIKAHLKSLSPEDRKQFVANINAAARELDGTKGAKKTTRSTSKTMSIKKGIKTSVKKAAKKTSAKSSATKTR